MVEVVYTDVICRFHDSFDFADLKISNSLRDLTKFHDSVEFEVRSSDKNTSHQIYFVRCELLFGFIQIKYL